jgi:hypothetical protein
MNTLPPLNVLILELRALIAEAVAKNDDDAKLLTAEENVLQLQEGGCGIVCPASRELKSGPKTIWCATSRRASLWSRTRISS